MKVASGRVPGCRNSIHDGVGFSSRQIELVYDRPRWFVRTERQDDRNDLFASLHTRFVACPETGGDGLVVSLAESGFFAAGEAAINPASDAAINAIAATLSSGSFQIRIEGHTDSIPISTARYPSNWELSTARAANVLARLIDRGIAPERLSAAGFAGFRPLEDNSTPEGRALNRRVDIVILDR